MVWIQPDILDSSQYLQDDFKMAHVLKLKSGFFQCDCVYAMQTRVRNK